MDEPVEQLQTNAEGRGPLRQRSFDDALDATRRRARAAVGVSLMVPQELPGVRVYRIERSTQKLKAYTEAFWLVLQIETAAEATFRGETLPCGNGRIGLLEPDGVFQHRRVPAPETLRVFTIDPARVREFTRELGLSPESSQPKTTVFSSPPLFRNLMALSECLEGGASALEIQSRYAACVRLAIQQAMGNRRCALRLGSEIAAVRRARELIDARFAENVTLSQLARAAGQSEFHLLRVFKRDVGVPPHTYQTLLRLARARELLARGKTASSTAAEVGFADQSHLTRHFRNMLGLTPRAYAKGSTRLSARGTSMRETNGVAGGAEGRS
jgi:AraC-like DNA-binding protein